MDTFESSTQAATELLAKHPDLDEIRGIAAGCQACELWKSGTQTVFGEGSARAKVILVGEQPGDQEDIAGKPFVGPAGRLLDSALEQAGIDRKKVYVTNVVKHFKWEPRGKKRIHKKPNMREIDACSRWLQAEIGLIRPEIMVCLGATAAQALLGKDFRVTRQRGQFIATQFCDHVIATVHPSSILRAPDEQKRALEMELFIEDLKKVTHTMSR